MVNEFDRRETRPESSLFVYQMPLSLSQLSSKLIGDVRQISTGSVNYRAVIPTHPTVSPPLVTFPPPPFRLPIPAMQLSAVPPSDGIAQEVTVLRVDRSTDSRQGTLHPSVNVTRGDADWWWTPLKIKSIFAEFASLSFMQKPLSYSELRTCI